MGRQGGKRCGWLVCAAVAGLLLAAAAGLGCGDDSDDNASTGLQGSSVAVAAANTVTVLGKAVVTSAPDEAILTLSVESDGADPGAAMNANTAAVTKVMERLKAEGVESTAVQTANVAVYPVRTYNPETGEETLTGYRAQNSVTVTFKDAEKIGKVLAASLETGVTNVSGLVWKLRDDSQVVADALKQAVANARTKAEALAEAQGVEIGDVIMMSEGSVEQPSLPVYTDMAMPYGGDAVRVADTPISAATLDVTATVTVTYALKR